MPSPLTIPQTPTVQTALITVQRSDGWRTSYKLEAGRSVMIGRSTNCGLQLTGDKLAPIHCMLRIQDGQLLLQDWLSSTGTFINGEPAHGEVHVPPGATIQLGDYTLQAEVQRDSTPQTVAPPRPTERVAGENTATNEPIARQQELEKENAQLLKKLHAANDENKLLRTQLQELLDQTSTPASDGVDPFAQETIELLRAEIEHLQSELLHGQTAVLENVDSADESASDIEDNSGQLLERMDQLLAELTQSDDRIAALEDLLRVAEEASEAEREERQQLESWVGDVERRVGERESDWRAEVESLRARLADATQKQRHMEQRLAATISAAQGDQARVQIEGWQARVEELEQQLNDSDQQQETLQQKIRELQQQITTSVGSGQLDEVMREERVKIAQERAELARGRAEVAALRAQLQQQANATELTGRDGDQRMRAFREHLKEIHEREQAEQPKAGLPTRLAKLWKRLDG